MENKEIEIYRIAEKTPKDEERVMVYRENGYEWRPQFYNDKYKCWDTSDGDDFEYNIAENDRWFSIEEL